MPVGSWHERTKRDAAMGRTRKSTDKDTPFKAAVSRHYQKLGGAETKGAATKTARAFGIKGTRAANVVKVYDEQIRDLDARRKRRFLSLLPLGASVH